jgi:hypothetical protein
MEDPETAVEKLGRFESDLKRRSADLRDRVSAHERDYDSGSGDSTETLRKIEKLVLDGQYLKSMERDLLKLKTRLGI